MKILKPILIILVIAAVLVGAFLVYRNAQAAQAAARNDFQTVQVTRGQLTASVGATGTVRANQTALLNWQTSGSVGEVAVQVGDTVKQGEVLASLSKTTLPQTIIMAQADLAQARRDMETLKTSTLAQAKAQEALTTAQKAYDDAKLRRSYLDHPRGSQEQVDAARANYYLAKEEVNRLQQIYNQFSGRPEDDPGRALALSNLSAARAKLNQSEANMNWYTGNPSEQDIAERDATLKLAEAQLADAQREWDRVKDGPDPNDLQAAQARIDSAEATLRLETLTAPFDGVITQANTMVGDQVSQGSAAASAASASSAAAFRVDDLSHLLVDVQLSEIDINRVKVQQPVNMTFDAIPDKAYEGTVYRVGQVGSVVQGTVSFTVTIEITNADESVRPGMTAAVNIVVNQLDGVLLVPNRAVRLSNGERVVYKRDAAGSPTPVTIQLGASSDVDSEVISGDLREGDTIILNPPAISSFQGGGGGGMFGGGR